MRKIFKVLALLIPLSGCVSLPEQPPYDKAIWLDQGWDDTQRHWYHHAMQGTNTFSLPYEFFIELEQPIDARNWYKGLAGKDNKFSDPEYLAWFGFIPSRKSADNPDNLPVGFAKMAGFWKWEKELDRGLEEVKFLNTVGLTCAGCHTGQLTYNGTSIRVDGASAVTNLADLTLAIDFALAETVKLPKRAERFKRAVTKRIIRENPGVTEQIANAVFEGVFKKITSRVEERIEAVLKNSGKAAGANLGVKEGFTRLDALNGIGNSVFGVFNEKNIVPRDAPVSYPQIWSASWFDWVQYDVSIMQPLVRNVGEAMGLKAVVQLSPTPAQSQLASTVDLENLKKMEEMLAGSVHPQQAKAFAGLRAPVWPSSVLGKIDEAKRTAGKKLYNELCVDCHRPPVRSAEFWSDKYWSPIRGGSKNFYNVVLKSVEEIGTDPAQSMVLADRKVDLSGMGAKLNGTVCNQVDGRWGEADVAAAPDQSFAFALGLIVERTIHQAVGDYESDRPNCLRAPRGYKARPLNGIWATAPFLHNGSVANLHDLLSPVSERAKVLYLGYQEFDPTNVGYVSTIDVAKKRGIDLERISGLSKVVVGGENVALGNRNTGHEFSDRLGPGVIGRALTESERSQLVEFLKPRFSI